LNSSHGNAWYWAETSIPCRRDGALAASSPSSATYFCSDLKSSWNTATCTCTRGMMSVRRPISSPVAGAISGVGPTTPGWPSPGTVPNTPRTSSEWTPRPALR
jgi:hypothetical protein